MQTLPNSIKRLFIVAAALLFLSMSVTLILNRSILNLRAEVDTMKRFLASAETIQPNFESSLLAYTDNTKHVIEHILNVRPDSKNEIIHFINAIEAIGEDLDVNLELVSLSDEKTPGDPSPTLRYEVSFYGNYNQAVAFFEALEDISYYTRVLDFTFRHSDLSGEERTLPNVVLTLQLYVQ